MPEHQSRLTRALKGLCEHGTQRTREGENIPSAFAIYSQFMSSFFASSAQITSCDRCVLLRSAARTATDLSGRARGVIGSAERAAPLCSPLRWPGQGHAWSERGKGSEPAGTVKENENFVFCLLKICLGWTLELLTLNLSLYQDIVTIQTIAQLKLLDCISLKHYLICHAVLSLKITACFSISSKGSMKEAAIGGMRCCLL